MVLTLAASVCAEQPVDVQVKTLDGQSASGTLQQWTDERIRIDTADGPRNFPIERLVDVRHPLEPTRQVSAAGSGVTLRLVDGTVLRGASATADQQHVTLVRRADDDATSTVVVSRATVASLQLGADSKPLERQWNDIRQGEATADRVVVRRNDALDYVEGVLGDVDADSIRLDLDGEPITIRRSKVYGLVFFRANSPPLEPQRATVTSSSGDRVLARQLALRDGTVKLVTRGGVEIEFPLEAITSVDYSAGKITYLGDLEPQVSRWTPYFGEAKTSAALRSARQPRADRAMPGGALLLDGVSYDRGLAVRSRTELVYRLPGEFRRFTATVGIDDRFRPRGNVKLSLIGDQQTLLEETIAGSDEPLSVDLDVTGVRQLKILVDFGEDLDVADHLDLCNARLLK